MIFVLLFFCSILSIAAEEQILRVRSFSITDTQCSNGAFYAHLKEAPCPNQQCVNNKTSSGGPPIMFDCAENMHDGGVFHQSLLLSRCPDAIHGCQTPFESEVFATGRCLLFPGFSLAASCDKNAGIASLSVFSDTNCTVSEKNETFKVGCYPYDGIGVLAKCNGN